MDKAVNVALQAAAQESTRTFHRTKRTTEQSGAVGPQDPEFSSSYYIKMAKGPQRAKGRPFPTNTILDYASVAGTGPSGRLLLGAVITPLQSELQAMATKLYAQNPASFGARGGGGATTQPVLAESAVEIYHLSTETMIDFTNFSNAGMHLELYDCHPKRNTSQGPQASWVEGLRDTQGHDAGTPVTGFPGGSQITITSSVVGSKPTDSEEFKSLWEIDFTRRIFLGPGDTHRHRTLHAPHKLLGMAALYDTEDGSSRAIMHGHSRSLLYAAYGAPAKLTSAVAVPNVNDAGTENHYVTTAPVDMGVIWTVKHRYSMLDFSPGGDIDVAGSLFASVAPTLTRIREADGDDVLIDPLG
jgi:hypothetical protein